MPSLKNRQFQVSVNTTDNQAAEVRSFKTLEEVRQYILMQASLDWPSLKNRQFRVSVNTTDNQAAEVRSFKTLEEVRQYILMQASLGWRKFAIEVEED
jgi:hypothetical protein